MEGARRLLLNAGIDADAVKVKIQNRKKGFARDIIREAKNGYDAVITRRRGMTGMRGIVLGSVATKLVEKLSFEKKDFEIRVFNPASVADKGVKILNYNSLDLHPNMILFTGSFNRKTGRVLIEEPLKKVA